MHQLLAGVRLILFDLDGTLYDDTHHFDIYARLVQEGLPEHARAAFWQDYVQAKEGEHPALRIGTLYHEAHDLVLHVRHGRVAKALRWDGSALTDDELRSLFPGPVTVDHATVMNVGDLWWVPAAVSAHHGGDRLKGQQAFLQVRDIMAGESFQVNPIPGLREALAALKGKVALVLATNSPQPDSEAILRKIGLFGMLDRTFFSSNKPAGLAAIFAQLAAEYGLQPAEMLSVGDNMVNEIVPAREFGAKTVFIDPHGFGEPDDADMIVRRMADFLPALRALAEA